MDITPNQLESALHVWQQSREFPPQLLDVLKNSEIRSR
jgi:hypothetical protein